ncbi:MAG: DUF4349 domain-containing protein, partial [Candidatus ainarchaeum sp.]|nr:DUF4349 domain-containing protein [Candidatus ainarchaeum sp.]
MSFKEQLIRLKENWLIILLVVVAFLVLTFLVSNGTSYSARDSFAMNESAMYSKSMEYAGGYGLSYTQDFAPEVEDRKITKNSSLSLEVKGGEFTFADSKVKSIVSSSDSIVLNESLNTRKNGNKEEFYASYSIKVESSKLDSVVSQLREIGKV